MATQGLLRDALGALPILGVLAAVYLLPPDTSLGEVRRAGALHVCLPPADPPFVTEDAKAPGIDVELLQALADDLGLTLATVPEPAMGQNFNPRAWHVTRAACEVLAGGLVASPMTRSFLETSPPYAQTGWAVLAAQPVTDLHGRKIGVFTVPSAAALVAGLREGRFEAGVTEKLAADQTAAREGLIADWLPGELPRYPIAFGLWKGDLTLKRAIAGGLDRLARDGTVAAVLARYLGKAGSPV